MSGSRTAAGAGGPTADRQLVFCHECQNEWYQEGNTGLQCLRCGSEFTEVIDPDFDPRAELSEPNPLQDHNPWAGDPEEDDIDDFTTYGHNHFGGRNDTSGHSGHLPAPFARQHPTFDHSSAAYSPLFGNFANMLQGMTGGRGNPLAFPDGPSPHRREFFSGDPSGPGSTPRQTGPRVSFWTSSGPGFTFTTQTSTGFSSGGTRAGGHQMDPQEIHAIMEGMFRNLGLPGAPGGASPRAGGFANPFANLFNTLLNPANAAHGDAVFSQEAFDRVMSQLMEEHTSGNAPGPASEAAINALPKKKVTESMLDETTKKAECSICMDDVTVGEEVTTLPCSHWFHFSCVEAWLKEHDTCPVCRTGIMPKDGDRNTVRTPAQPPLHDEDPFLLARRESGTRDHPFVVPESPTQERRRPNPRRQSSSNAAAPSSRQATEQENEGGGIASRMRSFFGGGGSGGGGIGGTGNSRRS